MNDYISVYGLLCKLSEINWNNVHASSRVNKGQHFILNIFCVVLPVCVLKHETGVVGVVPAFALL